MAEVGRQETAVFTWNPVEQMWIQERGPATKAPPPPQDVHAIQTWFLDTEENEWIQTVLGPMGRQLAEQWRGAHRVPDAAIAKAKAKPAMKTAQTSQRKGNPLPFLVSAAVLVALLGGVAVASTRLFGASSSPAPTSSATRSSSPAAVVSSGASATPASSPTPSAGATTTAPSATPEPTPEPTPQPTVQRTPVPTPPPATPPPATPPPPTPAPDFVIPRVGPAGTVFRFTFTGLPPAGTYRTSYTRGSVTTGYSTGEVPLNGVVNVDLRTSPALFPPDTYFFTIRSGDVVKTVSFRIGG